MEPLKPRRSQTAPISTSVVKNPSRTGTRTVLLMGASLRTSRSPATSTQGALEAFGAAVKSGSTIAAASGHDAAAAAAAPAPAAMPPRTPLRPPSGIAAQSAFHLVAKRVARLFGRHDLCLAGQRERQRDGVRAAGGID